RAPCPPPPRGIGRRDASGRSSLGLRAPGGWRRTTASSRPRSACPRPGPGARAPGRMRRRRPTATKPRPNRKAPGSSPRLLSGQRRLRLLYDRELVVHVAFLVEGARLEAVAVNGESDERGLAPFADKGRILRLLALGPPRHRTRNQIDRALFGTLHRLAVADGVRALVVVDVPC